MKMPKWPKGLKARLKKAEAKAAKKKAIDERHKEIAAAKAKLAKLTSKI